MYYIEGNNGTARGPFSPEDIHNFYSKGYIHQDTIFIGEDKKYYTLSCILVNSSQFDQSIMNITNSDVTLDIKGNLRVNQSTICESPDYTQISGFDDTCIPEEPDFSLQDVQRMSETYIDRRPIINMARRFTDTYLPFEFSWPDWVPFLITDRDALKYAAELEKLTRKLNQQHLTTFLKSINISNRCCSICDKYNSSPSEMLLHALSRDHIKEIYSQPGQVVSLIDVLCTEKIIEEVVKMETSTQKLQPTQQTLTTRKTFFFDQCNSEMAFISLRSGLQLCQKFPLMVLPDKKKDDVCDIIEALVLSRMLSKQFSKLPSKYRERTVGFSTCVKCEICDEVAAVSNLQQFQQHIVSEKHILSSVEKGTSRGEMENWIAFCRSITSRPKNVATENRDENDPTLQEFEFPLCVDVGQSNELKFCEDQCRNVIKFARGMVKSRYSVFDDKVFSTSCHWCDLKIQTKSHAIKHILYDRSHTETLKFITNEDIRMLFNLLQIQITVPLFKIPKSKAVVAESRKQVYISKLCRYLKNSDEEMVFCVEKSFPLSLVNHCQICDVEIDNTEDVIPHLTEDSHWQKMNKNFEMTEMDFDFWWKIFGICQ